MHALPFIAGSIHLITTVTTTAAQTCYYPNGEEAFKDTPCQTTQPGQTSACCASSAICLDNKLCLPQVGYEEVIWRGSCTDRSWQSGDCPQFCQDVATNFGVPIFPFQLATEYCCGPGNSSSGKCQHSTRGSVEPFPVTAGRVIFNRTSGSTSPNDSDTSSIATSSTATAPVTLSSGTALSTIGVDSSDSTTQQPHDAPSSSNKPTAIGVGVGVGLPCGLALLGTIGLLWRQRVRELDARREARDWEEKYNALVGPNPGNSIVTGNYTHERRNKAWRSEELDGRLVYEAPDRT